MTTNSCAVPSCNTGRKSVKKKYSVFKVPANNELRRKWISAIPGISDLSSSQFVCEKHFPERYIRRKWIKYDENGKIIAEAPYLRVRLDPSAVPSVFGEEDKVDDGNNAGKDCIDPVVTEHNYSFPIDKATADGIVDAPTSSASFPTIHPLDIIADSIETSFTQDVNTNKMALDLTPNVLTESMEDDQVQVQSTSGTSGCTFHFSEVAFSCTSEGRTQSTTIPKPWTVSEFKADGGSVLFSYAISKVENNENVPITERYVKLAPNKQLRYFVHGRVVDVDGCNLPQVLDNIDSLPQALGKFKDMNLCKGLGIINDHHLTLDSVFKDGVDQWRDRYCTLICKRKRCAACIKMRAVVLKRESREKLGKPLKRICKASNPIDQRKLEALCKKHDRIQRINQRTQKRVRSLEECLKQKAAEIALIREETLKDRCLKLNVPEA